MELCRRFAVPHSEFLSWSDDDRDLALTYERWLRLDTAETCPRCGTKETDWTDPETGRLLAEPSWTPQVRTCHGCRATAATRAEIPKGDEGDGLDVVLVRPASDDDDLTDGTVA